MSFILVVTPMRQLSTILILLMLSTSTFADTKKKDSQPTFSLNKQVGSISVLFDVVRVVTPIPLKNTTSPPSWRAYLPSCPPGSTYVKGVNRNMLELDQPPSYAYCNCICKGNCNGLSGISSPGGIAPIYTATVTCRVNVSGWFDSELFTLSQIATSPSTRQPYYYCQAGNCSTHALPASLNYSVPEGGFANTSRIDFQACGTLANSICGAPDPTSMSRVAGTI
jgi:hypothetical protein